VVVLSGVGFAAAPAWGDRDRDFNVTARVTDIQKEDNGKDGPSPGDRLTFTADLIRRGQISGRGDGNCVVTDDAAAADDFISRCRVTLGLAEGALHLEGKVAGSDFGGGNFTLPIDGGTGEFHDATGEARFTQLDDRAGDSDGGYRGDSGYGYAYSSGYGYPYTDYRAQSADSDPARRDRDDDGGKAGHKRHDRGEGDHHDGDRNDHRHDGDRDRDRDHNRCWDGHCRCWDCGHRCWDCHRGCWDCYDYYYGGYDHSCYDAAYSCGSYYDGHGSDYRNYPVFDVAVHVR
jgi:hypothetical protein